VSISQPPGQGRSKSGGRPGGKPGTTPSSGRPPAGNGRTGSQAPQRSGNGRSTTQKPGANRTGNQRSASEKTAGNRQVSAKNLKQGAQGRPGAKQAPGRPGDGRGRGAYQTPVQIPSRRPSPTVIGIGAVALVVIVVLVLVLVGTGGSGKTQTLLNSRSAAPASLVAQVSNVPESVFDKVGLPAEITNYPKKVKGQKPLTDPGLPEMLYMGAEYCPFCGAERWAMVMALSKFGTFKNLKITFSSVSDFAPDTATFSFYGSTYTSQYLAFKPFELATNQPAASTAACNVNGYSCLDTNYTSEDNNLFQKLGGGSFPFMDFGNVVMQSGAGFGNQPLALQGLTANQIAADFYTPTSAVAQAEDGSANYLTAGICAMTKNQPATVCSASYVKAAQTKAGL
jgi:hypothetical protein